MAASARARHRDDLAKLFKTIRLLYSGGEGTDEINGPSKIRIVSRPQENAAGPTSLPSTISLLWASTIAEIRSNTSECIRDRVKRVQEEQAKKRLRDLIEGGLASWPGQPRTMANEKELLATARGDIDLKPAALRPQALRGQRAEVRHYRKAAGNGHVVSVFDDKVNAR